jgi:hypothetical protein
VIGTVEGKIGGGLRDVGPSGSGGARVFKRAPQAPLSAATTAACSLSEGAMNRAGTLLMCSAGKGSWVMGFEMIEMFGTVAV